MNTEFLSDHAACLDFVEPVHNCVIYRIAEKPWQEWHSFACVPMWNGEGGYLIVSNTGDFTNTLIMNAKTNKARDHYWVCGVPIAGVLCVAQLFHKVMIVTTRSSIRPCLGTMIKLRGCGTACRVIRSSSSSRETFGDCIYNQVGEVDRGALIIDTDAEGRKNLVVIAYRMYMKARAEAMFCVSNKELTRDLVYEFESRGIAAFRPIWDS